MIEENSVFSRMRNSHLLPVLLLISVTAGLYSVTLGFDFIVNWDDDVYVLHNAAAQGLSRANVKTAFTSFYLGNYAPLQILSYALDYELWGMNPKGYHLSNVIIQAVCAVLFYKLVWKLNKSSAAAFMAALFFTVHPVQVESIAWIAERKNLLSMMFFLSALIFYIPYAERGKISGYLASLCCFTAAMLSKSIAVILPLVLILAEVTLYRKKMSWSLVVGKVPFVLLAGAFAILQIFSQSGSNVPYHGGSPYASFLTMLPVFVTYLRMVVWPSGLSVVYAPPIRDNFLSAPVLASFCLLMALLGVSFYFFRNRREIAFWMWFSFVAILPVSQVVPLILIMQDRFLYFPMLGFGALFGIAFSTILQWKDGWVRNAACSILLVVILALGVAAQQRAGVWRNAYHLWSDAITKAPGSRFAHQGMAGVNKMRGDLEGAAREYEVAVRLAPGSNYLHNELGLVYAELGNLDTAKSCFKEAVRLESSENSYVMNLALTNLQMGDLAEAATNAEIIYSRNPRDLKASCMLAAIYEKTGDKERSGFYYRHAHGIDAAKSGQLCATFYELLQLRPILIMQ